MNRLMLSFALRVLRSHFSIHEDDEDQAITTTTTGSTAINVPKPRAASTGDLNDTSANTQTVGTPSTEPRAASAGDETTISFWNQLYDEHFRRQVIHFHRIHNGDRPSICVEMGGWADDDCSCEVCLMPNFYLEWLVRQEFAPPLGAMPASDPPWMTRSL